MNKHLNGLLTVALIILTTGGYWWLQAPITQPILTPPVQQAMVPTSPQQQRQVEKSTAPQQHSIAPVLPAVVAATQDIATTQPPWFKQLILVIEELSNELNLTPEQQQNLDIALKHKANADWMINNQITAQSQAQMLLLGEHNSQRPPTSQPADLSFTLQSTSQSDNIELLKQQLELTRRERFADNQQHYRQQLEAILTPSQLNRYETFEQQKFNQQTRHYLNTLVKSAVQKLPSFNQDQHDAIEQFVADFQQQKLSQQQIKLGTYGNPASLGTNPNNNNSFLTELHDYLPQLLTKDQLFLYNH